MTTTLDRVCNCIATMPAFMKNRQTVTPDTAIVGDLDFDSLDQVELTMELEDEFDITITDEQAEACRTIGDVVALVDQLTGAQAAA